MNALVERWRSLSRGWQVVVAAVAGVVALNIALAGLRVATGGPNPGGPQSSSFSTGPDGLAAFASLVAEHGHPVVKLREALDHARLRGTDTVVLADPSDVTSGERAALARLVQGGGRLVVSGLSTQDTVREVIGGSFGWDPLPREQSAAAAVPLTEVAAVTSIEPVTWSLSGVGGAVPALVTAGHAPVAAVAAIGAGRVVALADTAPLYNAYLSRADNAAFGLGAVGEHGRVVFAEAQHGFGRTGTGLDAVPVQWRWFLAGLLLAAAVAMWARGRRLGPPETTVRALAPPRQLYVEAMATTMAKTRAELSDEDRQRIADVRARVEARRR